MWLVRDNAQAYLHVLQNFFVCEQLKLSKMYSAREDKNATHS